MKKHKESKEAVRKRVAAWRAKKNGVTENEKPVTELVTHRVTTNKSKTVIPVTDVEIANLPLSLRFQLQTITRSRKILHLPDNIRDREEMAVRYFRGY